MATQNSDLWREVFTRNLSEVFTKKLDMNSEHLDRDTPLKMDRLLTADFVCQNQLRGKKGVCGKKWDSTSVPVTFQYEIEFNGFSKFMNHGVIQIQEYKQRCQRCSQSQSFATPILDYESADRAAKKLKQKILEKFYGESPQEFPDSSHGRKERKKLHDQANCEACLKGVGVCAASERRGAGKGWGQEREVSAVVRRGPKIGKWVLKINNSKIEIVIENSGGARDGGGGSSYRVGLSCYNCQGHGHISRECPEPQKPRGGGRGGGRGRGGDRGRGGRGGGGGAVSCYNCQGEGHMSRDCPEPQKPRGGGRGGGRGRGGGGDKFGGGRGGGRGAPRGGRGHSIP